MAVEVTFRGDGGELLLAVEGYELPQIETGSDANWLKVATHLTLEEAGTGRTESHFAATVLTTEFEELLESLTRVLKRRRGRAELDHVEEEVVVAIAHEWGGWVLDCAVGVATGAPGRTEFQIPTDLDRARVTRDELEAIVQTYPTRGDPDE